MFKKLIRNIENDAIEIKVIPRIKSKPDKKFKIDGCAYYLYNLQDECIIFMYKSFIKEKVKSNVLGHIFNKGKCKDIDYIRLDGVYQNKINEFNGEYFVHSQYVTSVILDEAYKYINDLN